MIMELITILIQILGALFVYRIFLGFAMTIFSGFGALPKRVLQKFKSHKAANGTPLVRVVGRAEGLISFILTIMGLSDQTHFELFEDRIFYTGFEHDMDKFYSSIDLLILPSQLPDPLPTVVLEAMQYGIPVVATAQGGALEMIAENETGIFIPINSVEAAADKIQELLITEKFLIMRDASQQREKHFFSNLVYEQKISSFINSL